MGLFDGIFDTIGDVVGGIGDIFGGGDGIEDAINRILPMLQAGGSIAAPFMSMEGIRETNTANAQQAEANRMFQDAQMNKQRMFALEEASRNRQFEYDSTLQSRDFNASQAQKAMDFAERMSSTSWQRSVEDMKAAGLSPMLGYLKGGAASPGGSMGQQTPVRGSMAQPGGAPSGATAVMQSALGAGVNTGLAASKNLAEIDLLRSQANREDSQALLNAVNVPKAQAETILSHTTASKSQQETENLKEEYWRIVAEKSRIIEDSKRIHAEQERTNYVNEKLLPLEVKQKALVNKLTAAHVPGAENMAEAQKSWWMQNVSPYLPDILKSTSSAIGVQQLVK